MIKTLAKKIANKSTFLRKKMRYLMNLYKKIQFKINTIQVKTDKKTILFGTFNGKSYACTPKAIYEYLLSEKIYEDYHFIWVFEDIEKYSYLLENRNTQIVKNRSREFDIALKKSKYWFCNYRLYDYIVPEKNQVYIQCWHGTPLKRLGYDIENSQNAMNSVDEIYEKYRTDAERFKYLLSPSPFASEKFATAWNLEKTGQKDKIVEVGYPRNDYLLNCSEDEQKKIKKSLGVSPKKKVILYAPTWRDNQYSAQLGYTYKNNVDFDKMREELADEWIILFRAHYFVANSFDFEKYKGFVYDVSNYNDINELYVISDLLITDYSSVFFDFANLKRPMLFFMYDLQFYAKDLRGFYIDLEELPGPIVETEEEMLKKIKSLSQWYYYDEKYKKFNQKFNCLDDGKASKRLVEKVIECR